MTEAPLRCWNRGCRDAGVDAAVGVQAQVLLEAESLDAAMVVPNVEGAAGRRAGGRP